MPARQKFAFFGAVVCMNEIPNDIRKLHCKDAPSGRCDLRPGACVAEEERATDTVGHHILRARFGAKKRTPYFLTKKPFLSFLESILIRLCCYDFVLLSETVL